MGKLAVTSPAKNKLALEKTFSLESSGSVLNNAGKPNNNKDGALKKEIEALKKSLKANLAKKSPEKAENKEAALKKEIETLKKSLKADLAKKNSEKKEIVSVPAISNESLQMINALVHTQNHIVDELTQVFDKRLEKFDDIILDLIRCKTENERLKQKVDNLTRDNYKLKKDVESFKAVVPGLYIKRDIDKTKF